MAEIKKIKREVTIELKEMLTQIKKRNKKEKKKNIRLE